MTERAEGLRPILGEIARRWQRIHPKDLIASEALQLLGLLTEITDRIDAGQIPDTVGHGRRLRLVEGPE